MFLRRTERELPGKNVEKRFDAPVAGAPAGGAGRERQVMLNEICAHWRGREHANLRVRPQRRARGWISLQREHRISLPDARAGVNELMRCSHKMWEWKSRRSVARVFNPCS